MFRAPIGAATRIIRCCRASTAPPGSTRSSCRSISSASRRRPSATTARSGARWTCSTSRPRRMARVFWHPNGFIIWRQLEAYMRRRLDAAGYVEIKTPQLMDARQWEKSGHWGKYRENMFVVPDEIPVNRRRAPGAVGQGRPDGAEADELPGARPGLQAGHHQLQGIADPARRIRLLPSQRAARRASRHHAGAPVHPGRRPHLLPRGSAHRGGAGLLRSARRRSIGTSVSTSYAIKLALRPDKRFGSDEMWD